jgi:hypothetical protein
MNPTTAAKSWIQYLEPLRTSSIKLEYPAVTQDGAWWLREFFQACNSNSTANFVCAVD